MGNISGKIALQQLMPEHIPARRPSPLLAGLRGVAEILNDCEPGGDWRARHAKATVQVPQCEVPVAQIQRQPKLVGSIFAPPLMDAGVSRAGLASYIDTFSVDGVHK
jgi:hypothetical protein